jgi:histidinol phosphatase-like PHP family hydrolase
LTSEVQRLRSVDLHIHTQFSDGKHSLDEAYRTAQIKGLTYVAITDHYSEFTSLPNRMSKGDLGGYLASLERVPAFKGLEVEILEDGSVSMSAKTGNAFDVIVGGLHAIRGVRFSRDLTPILDAKGFVEDVRVALIKAMESRCLDVLAHVTWLPPSLRPRIRDVVDAEWIASVIEAASDFGVAIELNGRWRVPNDEWVKRCVHHGVQLSLGSDAHTLQEIGKTGHGVRLVTDLQVPKDLIYLPHNMTL